jgi:hypothetical protein
MELLSIEELAEQGHGNINVDEEINQMMFGMAIPTIPMTLDDYIKIVNAYITENWDHSIIQLEDIPDIMEWEAEEIREAFKTDKCPIELGKKISQGRSFRE